MALFLPSFGSRGSVDSKSLPGRILENLRLAFALPQSHLRFARWSSLPFAPLNEGRPSSCGQAISIAAHAAIFCCLLALLQTSRTPLPVNGWTQIRGIKPLLRYIPPISAGEASLGRHGGGGEEEALPAKKGFLAPTSSMPLVRPRLTHRDEVQMGVPPAVFDPNAPAAVPLITNLGLPWMSENTDSAGPGKGHGIGSGERGGMGDDDGDGAGAGDGGDYANFVSLAACVYCPEPPYTEEARKAKLQGTVTLRVLIGADGRAKRVQVLNGLGLGLDERASEAVRAWRFAPARNAQREPAASWVSIETRFQLL